MIFIKKKLLFLLVFTIFFLFFFSSFSSAISVNLVGTIPTPQGRGTGGMIFDSSGSRLFTIDDWHGSKPNFIYEYDLSSAYNISSLTFNGNFRNLSSLFPVQYQNYAVSAGYITRNGNNLYLILKNNTFDYSSDNSVHKATFEIMHFNMTNFDISTIVFNDNFELNRTGAGYDSPALAGIYVTDDGQYLGLSGGTQGFVIDYILSPNYIVTNPTSTNIQLSPTSANSFSSWGVYYNNWYSSDSVITAVIEKDLHQGSTTIWLGDYGVNNNIFMQLLTGSPWQGLTMASTFGGNIFLYTQAAGNFQQYQIFNLSLNISSGGAFNSGAGNNTLVTGLINPLLGLFPSADTLTLGQKLGYVLIIMFLTGFGLLLASSRLTNDGLHSFMVYIIGFILVIEFIFFVSIQYIPVGFLITILIIAIASIWLLIKMGNRGG